MDYCGIMQIHWGQFLWTVEYFLIRGNVISWICRKDNLLFENYFRRGCQLVEEGYPRIPQKMSHREF